jgi:cyclophilin family peptidyl-prolyl cis-trans isomerase
MVRHKSVIVTVLVTVVALVSCSTEEIVYIPEGPCSLCTDPPVVVIETTMGDISVELFPRESPITVGNFLQYVYEEHYEGLIFHRVFDDFIIQGGGYDVDLQKRPTRPPIPNEAHNGLSNERGTIAMARWVDIHSATSQFYINLKNNTMLDYYDESDYGYAVFGRVIEGMDVVDAIGSVETESRDGFDDIPVQPVIISRIYRVRPVIAVSTAP